jgi:hypothetical protein
VRATGLVWLTCLWVAASTLGGCGESEIIETDAYAIKVEPMLPPDAHVWQAIITTFNSDHPPQLLLVGHRGTVGPILCPVTEAPCSPKPIMSQGRDRHACAVADFSQDGREDLYCTSGADRGEGEGANELWYQVPLDGGDFTFSRVDDAGGAPEPTSRGRLAAAFRLDHDKYPDLLTTAWGSRNDTEDNQSKLWRNFDGRFIEVDISLPASFAARCLAVVDIEQNGLNDVIGCAEQEGLTLVSASTAQKPTAFTIADDRWFWHIAAQPDGETGSLAAITGTRGKLNIELGVIDKEGDYTLRRRISCRQHSDETESPVYCGALSWGDVNHDGHADLLVSRRLGWRIDEVQGDIGDLVFLAPDFSQFIRLPTTEFGAGYQLLAHGQALFQVNAGEKWTGDVRKLTLQPADDGQPASAHRMQEM